MRYDAAKEQWQPMEINGVTGYFSDLRIDKNTVPAKFHFWELADGDSDGTPCRYRKNILVNFFGTFITTDDLPTDESEHNEGCINSDDEWGFMDGDSLTLEEVIEQSEAV
jgi:hypothetical protein